MMEEPKHIEITEEGLAVQWDDSHRSVYPFKPLREQCKCANCIDEWSGRRILDPDSVSPDIEVLDFIEIGRYAVQLLWSDAHETGIYSFALLKVPMRLRTVQAGGLTSLPEQLQEPVLVLGKRPHRSSSRRRSSGSADLLATRMNISSMRRRASPVAPDESTPSSPDPCNSRTFPSSDLEVRSWMNFSRTRPTARRCPG